MKEYNVTIGHYWSPFLVESNCDSNCSFPSIPGTIRIESIEKNGRHWIDADILVFDTFAWWKEQWMIIL
ncbi:hypothetical protein ACS0TY_011919 [Phlomoides rotata]